MPGPRRLRAAPLVLVAVVALSACAGASVPALDDVPVEGPWTVDVGHPEGGGWGECFDDAALGEGFMSLDLPTSGASAPFLDDATLDDVERVLACLEDGLTSGDVSVRTR